MYKPIQLIRTRYANHLLAFVLGCLQVTLVAANTRQVARLHYGGAFIIGLSISLLWTWNVKIISALTSTWAIKFLYAFGAACGTILGMWLTHIIYGA